MKSVSLLGLGLGLAAGAAAGLLAAPMRGAEMRRSLRSRADDAYGRGKQLLDDGRRRFRAPDAPVTAPGSALSATLGEIAQMHSGDELSSFEARS